jgi:hypothetical protein
MLRIARRHSVIELACAKQRDGDDRRRYTVSPKDAPEADSVTVELTRGRDRRADESDAPTKGNEEKLLAILRECEGGTALSSELRTRANKAGIADRTF